MDERNGTPAHSPPDTALRRELLRPADARVPFVLALATALLAGVLGGYLLRAATEPTAGRCQGDPRALTPLSTQVVSAPTRLTAPAAKQAE